MSSRLLVFSVLSLLAFSGCKDREIATYRAPKDPPPTLPGQATGDNASATAGPFANASVSGDQNMAATAVPTASGGDLTWSAPAHWTVKPNGAMRKGSFAVKGDGGEADLSITAFPGSTGGLLANINRWRGQLGLSALAESELGANTLHQDNGELHLEVVDFAGNAAGKPTRILGAIVPHGSDTWFFKLMGPDALVEHEKPAFLDFLRTIKTN